jgi:hypothetical protein
MGLREYTHREEEEERGRSKKKNLGNATKAQQKK